MTAVVQIEKWSDFRKEIAGTSFAGPVYWRGQSNSNWVLASSFERLVLSLAGGSRPGAEMTYPYGGRYTRSGRSIWSQTFLNDFRSRYLMAFRDHCVGLRGPNPQQLTDDEWWALGRHYGLITPLLDWTESPYIAAFFAISGLFESQRNGAGGSLSFSGATASVFRLLHSPELESIDGFRILHPRVEELGRMHNQRGCFTCLNSDMFFELESFLDHMGKGAFLKKYILSDQVIPDALKEFWSAGIDSRLIFPDLHGAALASNELFDRSLYRILSSNVSE